MTREERSLLHRLQAYRVPMVARPATARNASQKRNLPPLLEGEGARG